MRGRVEEENQRERDSQEEGEDICFPLNNLT